MVDGPNVFAYVRQNPIDSLDPLGLSVLGGLYIGIRVGSCVGRAIGRADVATGNTGAIRHCVMSCEMKKCLGAFGGWLADYFMTIIEMIVPSDDWDADIAAGMEGRLCDPDGNCEDQCRNMGW